MATTLLRRFTLVIIASCLLSSCGGGGGSVGSSQPSNRFTIWVNPANPVVPPGGSNVVTVSVQSLSAFSGTVHLSVSNLPTGITANPSSFDLDLPGPGNSQPLTLSAAANTPFETISFTLTATSGANTASASVSLSIQPLDGFTLSASTFEFAVRPGTSVQTPISTSGGSRFPLNLSVGNLPTGVSVTFSASNGVEPGATVTMTIRAASNAPFVQNTPLVVTATRPVDGRSQQLGLFLNVPFPLGQTPPSRSDFLQTDGTPFSGVYDAAHRLLFVENRDWGRVDVISTQTRQIVSRIPVPYPAGLDLSVDGSTVFVGTWTRQLFAIDTASLHIVGAYMMPRIDANNYTSFSASNPKQLFDGTIFLLTSDLLTTATKVAIWNLTTNTVTLQPGYFPYDSVSKSADGSKVLLASSSSSGDVSIFDAATKTFSDHPFPGTYGITAVAVNHDGTRFLFFDDKDLSLYDQNFQKIGALPGGTVGGWLQGAVFKADGSRIYLVLNSDMTPTVVTVDTATLTSLGTAPAIPLRPPHGDMSPPFAVASPFGVDDSGLVFGGTAHGITFEDSAYFQVFNGSIGSPIYNNNVSPTSGPLSGGTRVAFWWGNVFDFLSDVWFGDQRGVNPAFDSAGQLYVTSPPSSLPGPVNLKVIEPSGVMVFNARAFSYEPSFLNLYGNLVSPDGGVAVDLFGFGIPTDPTQVNVKVGGTPATVSSSANAGYAFLPLVDVTSNVPPGTPGPADVQLSDSSGNTTLAAGLRYVQSLTDYPLTGTPAALLFDRWRNRIYTTSSDHVDVFSLDSRTFLSPISIPTANGVKQLGGMALTPDGSQLLVANAADGSVAIINPDNPASARVAAILPRSTANGCSVGPLSIAATNDGRALLLTGAAPVTTCSGGGALYSLNLTSLQVTQPVITAPYCGTTYLASVRDGSKIALGSSNATGFCIYDVHAGSFIGTDTFYGLVGTAAAGDGNVFVAGWKVIAPDGTTLNQVALPDPSFSHLVGNWAPPLEKVNDPGSLLFAPEAHFVDIFDLSKGQPIQRLILKETIPRVLDPLAINSDGSQIFLITDAGLTVVNLGWVPVTFGNISPASGVPGSAVRIRGTGFTSGTTITFNGVSSTATFLDSSTISAVVPALPAGLSRLTLTNPGEAPYTVEAVFSVK